VFNAAAMAKASAQSSFPSVTRAVTACWMRELISVDAGASDDFMWDSPCRLRFIFVFHENLKYENERPFVNGLVFIVHFYKMMDL
jgi:hypothetical protein